MDDYVQVKAGPQDVLAKPPFTLGLLDGALQALGRPKIFAPNVDVALWLPMA